jgi:hypothetical protein
VSREFDLVVVVGVLPFVQLMIGLYVFSCLPLFMAAQGWPLINLGIGQATALLVRMVIPTCALKLGIPLEKVVIPTLVLALLTGALSCLYPNSEIVVFVNVFACLLLPMRSTTQAAVVKLMPNDRTKALRMFESSYTLGYCMSSLWGSGLYSIGGWDLVIQCQTIVLGLTVVLVSAVRMLRPCGGGIEGRAPPPPESTAVQIQVELTDLTGAGGVAVSTASSPRELRELDPRLKRLCLFVSCGSFFSLFPYAAEWTIYLLHLSETFQLSTLQIGVGQMAGDVGGAAILLLSVLSNARPACTRSKMQGEQVDGAGATTGVTAPGNKGCAAGCSSLARLPFSMVWMAALYGGSFIAFASSRLEVAVAGQVCMGTMYVLVTQGCSELVDWCAHLSSRHSTVCRAGVAATTGGTDISTASTPNTGSTDAGICSTDSTLHQQSLHQQSLHQQYFQFYSTVADLCFTAGGCLGGTLSLVVFEEFSAQAVAYMCAAAIAIYFIPFGPVLSTCVGRNELQVLWAPEGQEGPR